MIITNPEESLLEDLMRFHKEAEGVIALRISEICSATCGQCQNPCCREDICIEAEESYFLALILEKRCEKNGNKWFDEQGCILQYGRPFLCRSFFCDELLALAPGKILVAKEFMNDWKLVYKNFAGNCGLLDSEPDKINPARLQKTLSKAEKFRRKWLS